MIQDWLDLDAVHEDLDVPNYVGRAELPECAIFVDWLIEELQTLD